MRLMAKECTLDLKQKRVYFYANLWADPLWKYPVHLDYTKDRKNKSINEPISK